MKKLMLGLLALTVLLLGSVTADAGRGRGIGASQGDGSCPVVITDGTPITVSGIVVNAAIAGGGIVIDTGDSLETVYGIGPVWFWEAANVDRPAVGESIVVEALSVELTNGPTIVAVSITVEGITIQLRDPVTGDPLWR